MWNTIAVANLKENLNKIAIDVHEAGDNEDFQIYDKVYSDGSHVSNRRNSHNFANSISNLMSPMANRIDTKVPILNFIILICLSVSVGFEF